MFRLITRIFTHHWRTYFFWSFLLVLLHLCAEYLPEYKLTPKEWGNNTYVSTITKIYATIYALGVPLLVNLFVNKLKGYKNEAAREFLVQHLEVKFFVVFTPIMIVYSILIQYMNLVGDIHVLILTLVIIYSVYRLFRLAEFCLAIAQNLDGMLSDYFENRYDEVLKKI